MKPSAITDCLKRCLALQPLVGGLEWEHDDTRWRLVQRGEGLWLRECLTMDGHWAIDRAVSNHEALCIWQDHFFAYLAGHSHNHEAALFVSCDETGWGATLESAMSGYLVESRRRPTLIEAVLDVCEQIQREGTDDA